MKQFSSLGRFFFILAIFGELGYKLIFFCPWHCCIFSICLQMASRTLIASCSKQFCYFTNFCSFVVKNILKVHLTFQHIWLKWSSIFMHNWFWRKRQFFGMFMLLLYIIFLKYMYSLCLFNTSEFPLISVIFLSFPFSCYPQFLLSSIFADISYCLWK